MKEVYRDELLHLIAKPQGFHFGARTATLEQLEEFSIEQLAQKMGVLCPHLSDLLLALLDANSVRRRRTQPETEPIDNDSSVESEGEEEEVAAEKETDPEEDDGDEDWEDVSNMDSDSDTDEDIHSTNSSDSDVSMQSAAGAGNVDGSSESLEPETNTALPERTSISPDAIEEQAEKIRRKRRRTQNTARQNRLLMTIVCLSVILCVNPTKKFIRNMSLFSQYWATVAIVTSTHFSALLAFFSSQNTHLRSLLS